MLERRQACRLIELAVSEFAPDWEVIGSSEPLTLRDPDAWMSGTASYGVTLRHRLSGAVKAIGWRRGGPPGAAHHRGLAVRVVEAYAERNTDPMRRFLQEVGVATGLRAARPGLAKRADHVPPAPPTPRAGLPPRPSVTAAPRVPGPANPVRPPAPSRRWSAPAARGRVARFLRLRPGPVRRLIERARPHADTEAGGRAVASAPGLALSGISPQLSVDGGTISVELSLAQGRGRIVLECSRVVDARFDDETGERAVQAILAAVGVGQ